MRWTSGQAARRLNPRRSTQTSGAASSGALMAEKANAKQLLNYKLKILLCCSVIVFKLVMRINKYYSPLYYSSGSMAWKRWQKLGRINYITIGPLIDQLLGSQRLQEGHGGHCFNPRLSSKEIKLFKQAMYFQRSVKKCSLRL